MLSSSSEILVVFLSPSNLLAHPKALHHSTVSLFTCSIYSFYSFLLFTLFLRSFFTCYIRCHLFTLAIHFPHLLFPIHFHYWLRSHCQIIIFEQSTYFRTISLHCYTVSWTLEFQISSLFDIFFVSEFSRSFKYVTLASFWYLIHSKCSKIQIQSASL